MADNEPRVKDAWQRIRRNRVRCFDCRTIAMCEPRPPDDRWLCDTCARPTPEPQQEIDGQQSLW